MMPPKKAAERLLDLDTAIRREALRRLVEAWQGGDLRCAPESQLVNMHCHTFYSYSGYDHSPASLAWLARQSGWRALGTVDFDVLDGVEETLSSCDAVGVRGVSGVETRVFLPEFPDREFNSPGEPGVLYYVGMGFVSPQAPPSAALVLADMRRRAADRNCEMISRVNACLDPVTIDYERDVLPLTPSGNATERHIVIAYDTAARRSYPGRGDLCAFWARKLEMGVEQVDAFLGDRPYPHDAIRSRLMKRGGVGYVQPGPDTFPALDVVNQAILDCGALPTYAFLDGASEGEAQMGALLELLMCKGMVGLTVIPDRNWNIADPARRAIKLGAFHELMTLARSLDLPVIVGTEMNKPGQRMVDDLDVEPLRPFRRDFLDGADWVYGHTLLQRALGLGYSSPWAIAHLPERRERNRFYATVGRTVAPSAVSLARIRLLGAELEPDALMLRLGDL